MQVRKRFFQKIIAGLPAGAVALVTPANAGSLEGARIAVLESPTDDGRACPMSSFRPVAAIGGQESFLPLLAAVASSFASKAVDGLVKWLEESKERLNGTRSATFTGEFYNETKQFMLAKCVTFTAGTFADEGEPRPDVYAEFVPISHDGGTFTLKPVYLAYNEAVAEAGRRKAKFTSLVFTYKYNVPKSKNEANNINSFELKDGPVFTLNYGQLRPGTVLDHGALEGVATGLGAKAPFYTTSSEDGSAQTTQPIAYQIGGLWSETADPSPLYTAAIGAVSDNKEAIGKEIGAVVKEILGLREEDGD